MAYQMAATVVTLNDFQGHSPVAGLFKCNSSNIYAAFYTDSTDSVLAVHLRQLNFTYESGDYRQKNSLFQKHGKWIITIHGRCFSQTYVHLLSLEILRFAPHSYFRHLKSQIKGFAQIIPALYFFAHVEFAVLSCNLQLASCWDWEVGDDDSQKRI